MPRILFATGEDKIEKAVMNKLDKSYTSVGTVNFKEVLQSRITDINPSIVIISENLSGSQPMKELLYDLKMNNPEVRLILLVKFRPIGDDLLASCAMYGVFDFISDDQIKISEIINAIKSPKTIADVKEYLPTMSSLQNNGTSRNETKAADPRQHINKGEAVSKGELHDLHDVDFQITDKVTNVDRMYRRKETGKTGYNPKILTRKTDLGKDIKPKTRAEFDIKNQKTKTRFLNDQETEQETVIVEPIEQAPVFVMQEQPVEQVVEMNKSQLVQPEPTIQVQPITIEPEVKESIYTNPIKELVSNVDQEELFEIKAIEESENETRPIESFIVVKDDEYDQDLITIQINATDESNNQNLVSVQVDDMSEYKQEFAHQEVMVTELEHDEVTQERMKEETNSIIFNKQEEQETTTHDVVELVSDKPVIKSKNLSELLRAKQEAKRVERNLQEQPLVEENKSVHVEENDKTEAEIDEDEFFAVLPGYENLANTVVSETIIEVRPKTKDEKFAHKKDSAKKYPDNDKPKKVQKEKFVSDTKPEVKSQKPVKQVNTEIKEPKEIESFKFVEEQKETGLAKEVKKLENMDMDVNEIVYKIPNPFFKVPDNFDVKKLSFDHSLKHHVLFTNYCVNDFIPAFDLACYIANQGIEVVYMEGSKASALNYLLDFDETGKGMWKNERILNPTMVKNLIVVKNSISNYNLHKNKSWLITHAPFTKDTNILARSYDHHIMILEQSRVILNDITTKTKGLKFDAVLIENYAPGLISPKTLKAELVTTKTIKYEVSRDIAAVTVQQGFSPITKEGVRTEEMIQGMSELIFYFSNQGGVFNV